MAGAPQTPTFIINSAFDHWQAGCVLGARSGAMVNNTQVESR
jgi:hypothetical protein